MNNNVYSFNFFGISINAYLVNDDVYVTLSSVIEGLEFSKVNITTWLERHHGGTGIQVNAGKAYNPEVAYPLIVIHDYLNYRVSLGDVKVKALFSKVFQDSLETAVRSCAWDLDIEEGYVEELVDPDYIPF
jgi:hypothetical protein